ncbi:clathrin assembly protein [Canna indica]|uniref:Clathrin assembly protein n=1 Tax=Canna indica TaxID=4628 RepID=A0AAQ3KZ30_9LILI|nr:clathrin assembly protein [Canna indica]
MAGVGNTQQSIRKALGALKDTTTVGLAKVNSDYKELDVAIIKATNHLEQLAKEKHIRTIFDAISASRPRADVAYCINALARRLSKTHNWAVAIKTLIVLHRALREVDPTFREEFVKYTNTRGWMLNLSHFRDDSSPNAWDYSAWVRTYALYLEERLQCFRVLKYDIETERSRILACDTAELLVHLPALQQLLFRLLGCQPEGAATYNNVVIYALSIVAGESIKIYGSINSGTLSLVDKFFEMQPHDAVRAIEIYKKTGIQAENLSEFYEICKGLGIGRGELLAKIEQPPASFIAAMEDYVKDVSNMSPNKMSIDNPMSPKPILAIEYSKDKQKEAEPTPAQPQPPASETAEAPVKSQTVDLLGLDEFNHSSAEMEQKNAQVVAVVPHDNLVLDTFSETSRTSGWELALVGAPSSNENAVAQSTLAGGFDRLTLDSLYDYAIARTSNPSGGYHMGQDQGQGATNPFETIMYPQDPFCASNSIAPPPNVQMAAMSQQQPALLMQQQQQAIGQDGTNPFGNPFVETGAPYTPTHDPSHNNPYM